MWISCAPMWRILVLGSYTRKSRVDRNSCKVLSSAASRASLGRGVRVAEGARLESVCGGNLTVGSNPTLSATPSEEHAMIAVRASTDRGRTKLDWLDSRHTFSFGGYFDPNFVGFRSLRVIN